MTVSRLRPLALAALAFAMIGCDQGRQNPPDVTVRVLNVAPSYSGLVFRRERSDPEGGGEIAFKNGAQAPPYDEDTYDFSVSVLDLQNVEDLKRSFEKKIVAGTLYTFVLAQVGLDIKEVILEAQPPAPSATDTQVLGLHAAEGLAAMDVFLERPGTVIAGAVPWGSVGFLAQLPTRSVPTGDYQVTLTEAGNRANVLLTSATFTLPAATSTAFVITPEADEGLAQVSVTVASSTLGSLFDRNSPAAVRVINGAADAAPRDVAFNSEFSPPLFSGVPFAAPTAYAEIAGGAEIAVNVTPAGNPGVFELDQKVTPFQTRRHTLMFTGTAGALTHVFTTDDGRRIVDEAQLRFYNAAMQFTGLDLLFLTAGSGVDPTTAQAALSLGAGNISIPIGGVPATYDIYLRQSGTATIVAGPIPVTLAAEGIYGILATNGPDAATATVTLVDDFQ